MSSLQTNFLKSQSDTRENRKHFPFNWIYERHRAIYSTTWQKEKCVYITTQLYLFDGGECKQLGLCIFIQGTHTHTEQSIYLSGRPLSRYQLPLFYHLWYILSWGSLSLPLSLFKVLSSFQAGIVCGRWKCLYLIQIIGMSFLTASVPETIPWPKNGNKPLAETSDKRRTISHCMCVHMHLCVFACMHLFAPACSCSVTCKCQCVCSCLCVMEDYRSYRANTSVGPLARHACSMVILPSVCLSSQ